MIRAIFAVFAVALGSVLSFNRPPRQMPVVRFNENHWAKRVYARTLSGTALVRQVWHAVLDFFNRIPYAAGTAGLLNTFVEPLPDFDFQAAVRKADMPKSLYIQELYCVLTGNLDVGTITAGAADGTLMTEAPARLIEELRVKWDGVDLYGPISGRDAVALSRRLQVQGFSTDDITIPGVQTTDFKLPFVIPFSRRYLADPFDTVLPPLEVKNEFTLSVKWNQSVSNAVAGTTAGSGAIVDGGDRSVTLTDVKLVVTPRIARNGKKPWAIPVVSTYETAQIAAAIPKLPLDMRSPLTFDGVLLRVFDGGDQDPTAGILLNTTFKAGQVRILNELDTNTIRMIEEQEFPAVQQATEDGTHFLLMANGGKLGNAVNPAELSNPEFQFNMATPPTGPSFIRAITMELLHLPKYTRGGPV